MAEVVIPFSLTKAGFHSGCPIVLRLIAAPEQRPVDTQAPYRRLRGLHVHVCARNKITIYIRIYGILIYILYKLYTLTY